MHPLPLLPLPQQERPRTFPLPCQRARAGPRSSPPPAWGACGVAACQTCRQRAAWPPGLAGQPELLIEGEGAVRARGRAAQCATEDVHVSPCPAPARPGTGRGPRRDASPPANPPQSGAPASRATPPETAPCRRLRTRKIARGLGQQRQRELLLLDNYGVGVGQLGSRLLPEAGQLLLPNHPCVAKPAAVRLDPRVGELLALELLHGDGDRSREGGGVTGCAASPALCPQTLA